MKNRILLILYAFLLVCMTMQAQEKRIDFNSGVVKICSSTNLIIKGHDGEEMVIKSLNNEKGTYITQSQEKDLYESSNTSNEKRNRGEGLTLLGKKLNAENNNGIFLLVEQNEGELILTDDVKNSFYMTNNLSYEILIPNSVSIIWNTGGGCNKKSRFFRSNHSQLIEFKGEVEIMSTLNNISLIDTPGPVAISTIGGNVAVVFNKNLPIQLYSIYSNNGFIDITLPKTSSVLVDASGEAILSDIDFTVVSEEETHRNQRMKLKLGGGKTKMKLDAGLGTIYLRKNNN